MEALIVNFRGGKHTKYDNHMILKVSSITTKDQALSIVGKKVLWESTSGKKILGIVRNTHGNSGCVRAIFEKGMPGQSIATKVRFE